MKHYDQADLPLIQSLVAAIERKRIILWLRLRLNDKSDIAKQHDILCK